MIESRCPQLFPVTRWTLLERLRRGSESDAREALDVLCKAYWYPLYCVARQKLLPEHDAQDAVQGFFESILKRETFATADEATGKLRQLLLRSFDNYCNQQWQRAHRQKRGGRAPHVELSALFNTEGAEQRYQRDSAASESIETLYNREWASALMERSLHALKKDYETRGWKARYDLLVSPLLQTADDTTLSQLADSVGMSAGSLRVTLHRMRGHFRDKIERELAATLNTEDPQLIRDEMIELFKAFS